MRDGPGRCRRNQLECPGPPTGGEDPLAAALDFAPGPEPTPLGTEDELGEETDHAFYEGKVDGKLVDTFPFPVTMGVLERGKQRFDIYCSVCHGYLGDGIQFNDRVTEARDKGCTAIVLKSHHFPTTTLAWTLNELVDALPTEPHDVRMTGALTPIGGYRPLG